MKKIQYVSFIPAFFLQDLFLKFIFVKTLQITEKGLQIYNKHTKTMSFYMKNVL